MSSQNVTASSKTHCL